MRLRWFYASQLPSHIWIIRASFLHVGDRLRPEDPASGLLINWIVLDDCITRQHGPSIGCKVKLSKPESRLVKSMQKNVLRDLIGNIKRFLDQISRQFELIQYLCILVKLLQHDVVDLLRPQQQFVKLQDIHASDVYKLLVVLRVVGVEVDPLKLDDGVGVHPLRGDLGIEPELLDLNGSELVEILGGAGIQEHTDLAERTHVVLVLQNLHPLYLLVRLPFFVDLTVLVLHLLSAVGHIDHDVL